MGPLLWFVDWRHVAKLAQVIAWLAVLALVGVIVAHHLPPSPRQSHVRAVVLPR